MSKEQKKSNGFILATTAKEQDGITYNFLHNPKTGQWKKMGAAG